MAVEHYLQIVIALQGIIIVALYNVNIRLYKINGTVSAHDKQIDINTAAIRTINERCMIRLEKQIEGGQ